MKNKNLKTKVSYFPINKKIESDILTLSPLNEIESTINDVNQNYYNDTKFCFPKVSKVKFRKEYIEGEFRENEISRSPSYMPEMFRFYPTHEFALSKDFSNSSLDDSAKNPSFFLMQIIAYIEGFRIMPEEFFFDGKIPIKPTCNLICRNNSLIIKKSLERWLKLNEQGREELTGLFYFFNRSPSYHWQFEQFSHDFMIFDSLFKFYLKHYSSFKYTRDTRYGDFLNNIKVNFEESELINIVNLRNDLFHQFKWGDGKPCLNPSSEMVRSICLFRRMLHAVLARFIDLDGPYFENQWNCIGTILFDVK